MTFGTRLTLGNEGKELCAKSQSVSVRELFRPFAVPYQRNIFVILNGYFDESYNRQVFTLCCSCSNFTGWSEISRAWKKCIEAKNKSLRAEGRPEISRYHCSEANSRTEQFKGWSRQERDALAIQLMSTLSRGRAWITTVAYSLPLQELIKEFKIEGDPLPFCYKEALRFIMIEMYAQMKAARQVLVQTKPLKYVLFHERSDYDTAYLEGFNALMNDPTFEGKELFTTIAPMGWEDCIPLQPADMLAYETFKDALRQFNHKDRRPSLNYLLQSSKFGGRAKQMNEENIKEWRDIIHRTVAKEARGPMLHEIT